MKRSNAPKSKIAPISFEPTLSTHQEPENPAHGWVLASVAIATGFLFMICLFNGVVPIKHL